MEIVDWMEQERKDKVMAHFLIEAMSKVDENLDVFKKEDGKLHGDVLEIEMTVNGVSVPFMMLFDLVDEHINNYEDRFKDKIRQEVLKEFAQNVVNAARKAISEVVNLDEYDL